MNEAGADGLLYGSAALFKANLMGTLVVIAYTMIMTFVVLKVIGFFMDVRVSAAEEQSGLDATQHGEKAFVL